MQVAGEATVLGDFAERRFALGTVTSTFFRREGRFMVRTDGPMRACRVPSSAHCSSRTGSRRP
jgi:hypothetical protein